MLSDLFMRFTVIYFELCLLNRIKEYLHSNNGLYKIFNKICTTLYNLSLQTFHVSLFLTPLVIKDTFSRLTF